MALGEAPFSQSLVANVCRHTWLVILSMPLDWRSLLHSLFITAGVSGFFIRELNMKLFIFGRDSIISVAFLVNGSTLFPNFVLLT